MYVYTVPTVVPYLKLPKLFFQNFATFEPFMPSEQHFHNGYGFASKFATGNGVWNILKYRGWARIQIGTPYP